MTKAKSRDAAASASVETTVDAALTAPSASSAIIPVTSTTSPNVHAEESTHTNADVKDIVPGLVFDKSILNNEHFGYIRLVALYVVSLASFIELKADHIEFAFTNIEFNFKI